MKALPNTAATSGGPTADASALMSGDLLIGKVCARELLESPSETHNHAGQHSGESEPRALPTFELIGHVVW